MNNFANKENREIEVKFLEIDSVAIKNKLLAAGGVDLGADDISEIIFYGKDFKYFTFEKMGK